MITLDPFHPDHPDYDAMQEAMWKLRRHTDICEIAERLPIWIKTNRWNIAKRLLESDQMFLGEMLLIEQRYCKQ